MTGKLASVTLYPKRSSAIWLLIGCSAFVVGGIWLGASEGLVGYLCAALFALGIPVAVIQLLPGSACLHIDHEGFTIRSLFQAISVPWSVVDRFFVVTLRSTGVKVRERVAWNFVASYDRARFGRKVAMIIGQCEAALPDTYGKRAEDLAALMNAYLDATRAEGGEPASAADG
jgi:hypothetical protein